MIPPPKGSDPNQFAQPSTRRVKCSGDDVAVQWRKSAKKGFSGKCCPGATLVPARFQRSARGKNRQKRFQITIKLSDQDLLNLGLWWCIAGAPATSGRSGKDMNVKLKCMLADFATDESGATAIEYGLIAAGIALAIIEVIYALGTNLVAKLQALATALK
jgi:Flp pilus assembly pilin Flp